VPLVIESLEKEGFRAVQVAAGDSVSIAVSDKGKVRAWGSFRVSWIFQELSTSADKSAQSNDGVLGFDGVPGHSAFQFNPIALSSLERAKVEIVKVSCGENHVLALTTTGHVYVWGSGQQSELGRRIIERRKLNGLEPERLGLRNITLVSAGTFHSFAVNVDGTVWAWGLNTFHQTGLSSAKGGNEDIASVPAQVEALSPDKHDGAKVIQIEGGEHHSIFLFDNGEVWGCGRSNDHQLGIAEDHPAFEEIMERRAKAMAIKKQKIDAAQRKVDAASEGEAKEESEMELAGAQAILHAALDEFVPQPVRVSLPLHRFSSWPDGPRRFASRLSPRHTKLSRPSHLTPNQNHPIILSPKSRQEHGTTSQSRGRATSTHGVWAVSCVLSLRTLLISCSPSATRSGIRGVC